MIGIVVVSHSARLAEGVCELAGQVAQDRVRLAPCGGTEDGGIGTDPFRVLAAIESVYSDDGVLVVMDLGSAVLSSETALELLDENKRRHVRLCGGPLVEGAVAAAALAGAGASLDEVAREAAGALAGKVAQLGGEPVTAAGAVEVRVTVRNPLGLHARPASRLVRLARPFDARVALRNESTARGPADAASINALLGLGARGGHTLLVSAAGPAAQQACAAVVAFIESRCGDAAGDDASAPIPLQAAAGSLRGIAAGGGFAVGPLVKAAVTWSRPPDRAAGDVAAEEGKLHAALHAARQETRGLFTWAVAHAGERHAAIFDAQLAFLEDPELIGAAENTIREQQCAAEAAWYAAAEEVAGRLDAMQDEYLRARAADVRDVAARVMRSLIGQGANVTPREPCVVAAHDLMPSQVKEFDPARVSALCLEMGSASAHSAILARAMGIPVVVGLGPGILAIDDGTTVAVDGETGNVWVSPDNDQRREFERRRQAWLESRRSANELKRRPAATGDGQRIRVFANISGVEEASPAVEYGAEGVGVLRTEFLFLDRLQPPSEEEQVAAYSRIAAALNGRPLVIRTLDIGGDKSVPYVDIGEEANPFLGWRGLRLTLDRRDLLRVQLRAILRAAARGPVEILLPMVCSLCEFREAQKLVSAAQAELTREGLPAGSQVRLGVMIEAPAAVAVAPQLAREASFFSIGTNDLVQYVMVADRTNPRVASIADPFQPAVLQMMRQAIAAARAEGIGVTVCGEMAGDPLAAPLLIGMGVEELSVSAPLIPELKRTIARCTLTAAREIAERALLLDSREAVRQLLAEAQRNLQIRV